MTHRQKANALLFLSLLLCLGVAPWKNENEITGFVFHISFAMTVGGVADWFGVTSLFRRPLGFSWHTDLIARNRDTIVHMAKDMVREEFFTEARLKELVLRHPLPPLLYRYLFGHQKNVVRLLEAVLDIFLSVVDKRKVYERILYGAEEKIALLPWSSYIAEAMDLFIKSPDKKIILSVLSEEVGRFLSHQVTQEEISRIYDGVWREYKKRGWLRGLLESTVEEEKAKSIDLVQEEVRHVAESLQDPHSEMSRALLGKYEAVVEKLRHDDGYKKQVDRFVQKKITHWLHHGGATLLQEIYEKKEGYIKTYMAHILWREALLYVQSDTGAAEIQAFVAAKSDTCIPYVRDAIGRLTEEALSLYDGRKMADTARRGVENDVQMIRINGTLCGGILGGLFYLVARIGGVGL